MPLSELNEKKSIVLWENPDPAASFPAQTITLSSDDYDYLKIYYWLYANGPVYCHETLKGCSTALFTAGGNSGGAMANYRALSYVDDLHYSVAISYGAIGANAQTSSTAYVLPIKIMSGHF